MVTRYINRLGILLVLTTSFVDAQTLITVETDKPKFEVKPTMWGVFFEDINFGADGGLYAEMVKNRSFEFAQPLMGWKEQKSDRFALASNAGKILVVNTGVNSNERFARVTINADAGYGIANEGFRGMGIKKGERYNFSVSAAQLEGTTKLRINVVDAKGNVIGEGSVTPSGKAWKMYTASFTASA